MSLGCILVQGALDNHRTPQEQSLASVVWRTLALNITLQLLLQYKTSIIFTRDVLDLAKDCNFKVFKRVVYL